MRIGLVDDMAWRMRQVDMTDAPCLHCGHEQALAYAEVFEARSFEPYPNHPSPTEAVVCKLCNACANAHEDWKLRGRRQVERDAGGEFTTGWLVQVTLRSQLTHKPTGVMRGREAWLEVLPKFE